MVNFLLIDAFHIRDSSLRLSAVRVAVIATGKKFEASFPGMGAAMGWTPELAAHELLNQNEYKQPYRWIRSVD